MDGLVPFCKKFVWWDHEVTFLDANLNHFPPSFLTQGARLLGSHLGNIFL